MSDLPDSKKKAPFFKCLFSMMCVHFGRIFEDLSSAFDTVDHRILLERLSDEVGIRGTALNWFRSYLSDRSQRVSVHGVLSCPFDLNCGVP